MLEQLEAKPLFVARYVARGCDTVAPCPFIRTSKDARSRDEISAQSANLLRGSSCETFCKIRLATPRFVSSADIPNNAPPTAPAKKASIPVGKLDAMHRRNAPLGVFVVNGGSVDCHPFFAKSLQRAISVIGASFVGKHRDYKLAPVVLHWSVGLYYSLRAAVFEFHRRKSLRDLLIFREDETNGDDWASALARYGCCSMPTIDPCLE